MYEYTGVVTTVESVEKITVKIKIGFSITIDQKFHLYGIESYSDTNAQSQFQTAKDRLKSYILDKRVIIKSYRQSASVYLADVYIETSKGIISINDWLVKEKLAKYKISKTA